MCLSRSRVVALHLCLGALLLACLLAPSLRAQQPVASPAAPAAPRIHSLREARVEFHDAQADHPGDTEQMARALIDMAEYQTDELSPSQETLDYAERAVRIAEAIRGRESTLYADALDARAMVLTSLDRPEAARPLAEEALAIDERVAFGKQEQADAASLLSRVCRSLADYVCALRNSELAAAIVRRVGSADPMDLANDLNDLVDLRRQAGDVPGARAALEEALALAAHAGSDTLDRAVLENNAGAFYIYVHEYPAALDHLKKGLDLSLHLEGAESSAVTAGYVNLASVEMCLGRVDEGLRYYSLAHERFLARYGAVHTETARVDFVYARALSLAGQYSRAVDLALGAHRLERERIHMAIQVMPERQALAMASTASPSLFVALSLALRHPEIGVPAVYQEVVRSRALVAEEMAQRAAALHRAHDPALESMERDLEVERKSVLDLQAAPPGDHTADALVQATRSMEKTERALAERSAAFRSAERAQHSDLADLRRNLPQGSVLVSYVEYANYSEQPGSFSEIPSWRYLACVMHRDSPEIALYDLGKAEPMHAIVRRMRASAEAEARSGGMGSTRNEREYREAALQLRRLVWDPLKPAIGKAGLVFVVPDGILNLVPFAALPQGNGYLVDRGPVVHVLTTERDLLPTEQAEKRAGLVAIGGPSFELTKLDVPPSALRDAGVTCDTFNKMQFQPLPASLQEVRDISTTFRRWNAAEPEQLLTGENATRAQFLAAAPQSRVLHIATHAFVLEKKCGNGNPLLHSGLVFAGANTDRNGAILTAQQIASLDLRGVDWAVLSACNTAYGELKDGEGVLGLQRSFRVAGAKTVIMALWPVEDESTRDFMRRLYGRRFALHESTAHAFWNTARAELAARRAAGKSTHPWYWASFVAAGSWQ